MISLADTCALTRIANICFPGFSPSAVKLKAKILLLGNAHSTALVPFLHPDPEGALAYAMAQRPQMLGALVWPYQCAAWDVEERLARIRMHYDEIDRIGAPFLFDFEEKIVVSDLSDIFSGARLVVDQPQWFMREGGLVLNLFLDSFRAFSLAFSFYRDPQGDLVAVVGGLQGRNRQDALDLYRKLTKGLYGLRPRDLLFEVFRMLCRHIRVGAIHAVTQAQRHHTHPFFVEKDLSSDYDAIWEDRQGVRMNDHFYLLSVDPEARDLSTVKPNKRALYRKRFVFLKDLEERILTGLDAVTPIRFVDT